MICLEAGLSLITRFHTLRGNALYTVLRIVDYDTGQQSRRQIA